MNENDQNVDIESNEAVVVDGELTPESETTDEQLHDGEGEHPDEQNSESVDTPNEEDTTDLDNDNNVDDNNSDDEDEVPFDDEVTLFKEKTNLQDEVNELNVLKQEMIMDINKLRLFESEYFEALEGFITFHAESLRSLGEKIKEAEKSDGAEDIVDDVEGEFPGEDTQII